jgi:hypothetical protein
VTYIFTFLIPRKESRLAVVLIVLGMAGVIVFYIIHSRGDNMSTTIFTTT